MIEDAMKNHGADYLEVRIEEQEGTEISFRGKDLEDLNRSISRGGSVRACVRGGWGFVSFNDIRDLKRWVSLAVEEARLVGKEKTTLAEIPPFEDVIPLDVGKDPRSVSLSEKKRTMEEYNNIILGNPKIQTSLTRYRDRYRKTHFANTMGAYFEHEGIDLTASFMAIARDGTNVQTIHDSLGSAYDYGVVEKLHERAEKVVQKALDMLKAKPVKGGNYTVVLDPKLAGVFAHEAFGHLSESDFVYENEKMKEIMVLGRRFGGDDLTIVDDPTHPRMRGSIKYDDEGTPTRKNYLIRDGILVGRLHSKETAAKMGEAPTGNARCINFRHPPIVRMTNTYIEPRSAKFEDMIGDIKEGIYAVEAYGGQTAMEMFTFSAGYAYMIRNGEVAELIKDVVLTGNVFDTLKNIEAIGDDILWENAGGGCGKGGQFPLPVYDGSPHLRIRNVVVGGR
ncbi:MAG: TldD/PmbA family protein [bacterium]